MRREHYEQVAIVKGESLEDFEAKVNARLRDLGEKTVDKDLDLTNLVAVLLYEETEDFEESVRDEFYAEGKVFLCKQCPHIEIPTDKRRKWVPCKYNECGTTTLGSECCELFYKQLKQGAITPRYLR